MRLPGIFLEVIHAKEEKSVVGVAASAAHRLVGSAACRWNLYSSWKQSAAHRRIFGLRTAVVSCRSFQEKPVRQTA